MHRIGGIWMGPRKRHIKEHQDRETSPTNTHLDDDVRSQIPFLERRGIRHAAASSKKRPH